MNIKANKTTKEGQEIEWTPIFNIDNSDYYTGFDQNGCWFTDTAEGLKLVIGPGVVGLLPILEKSKEEFLHYLEDKLKNINQALTTPFPVEYVVTSSFSISTYWAELGIEWLEEKDIDDNLAKILNERIAKKAFSQKFRHKAFTILKRREMNKFE